MGDRTKRRVEWLAVGEDQSPGKVPRGGYRNLLAQHAPDGQLVTIHGTRDAPARCRRDEWREGRVGCKHLVDSGTVGVEVEQPTAASDCGGQVARVGEPQCGIQKTISGSQFDDADSVRQHQAAPVGLRG